MAGVPQGCPNGLFECLNVQIYAAIECISVNEPRAFLCPAVRPLPSLLVRVTAKARAVGHPSIRHAEKSPFWILLSGIPIPRTL